MQNGSSVETCPHCVNVFARLAPICYAQSMLIDKISAPELRRKFIKSALLVGSFSSPSPTPRWFLLSFAHFATPSSSSKSHFSCHKIKYFVHKLFQLNCIPDEMRFFSPLESLEKVASWEKKNRMKRKKIAFDALVSSSPDVSRNIYLFEDLLFFPH